MKTIKVSELKEGDIFSFGSNVWDGKYRFVNIRYYKGIWLDNYEEGCTICFWLSYVYSIEWKGMIKWSDTNSIEQLVYIPEFPMSNHKKTKGMYCIPHGNARFIFPYELNQINKGTTYCPDN